MYVALQYKRSHVCLWILVYMSFPIHGIDLDVLFWCLHLHIVFLNSCSYFVLTCCVSFLPWLVIPAKCFQLQLWLLQLTQAGVFLPLSTSHFFNFHSHSIVSSPLQLDQWLVSCRTPNCPGGNPCPYLSWRLRATETIPPPHSPLQLQITHTRGEKRIK